MNSVLTLPNNWAPRPKQEEFFNNFGHGKRFRRASVVWHRRYGKDTTVLNIMARDIFKRVGSYWHLFPLQKQARIAIWNGVDNDGKRILDKVFPLAIRKRTLERDMMIEFTNGSIYQLVGSDNYDSLVGSNPVAVVFTEWGISDPAAWDYIRPMIRANSGWAAFVFTPRGRTHGYVTHQMAEHNPKWFYQTLTVDDTGAISEAEIQEDRDEGYSEAKIQQEYYCSFEADDASQFISGSDVAEARTREAFATIDDEIVMGVDVARKGNDRSCIYVRQGNDARSHGFTTYETQDTMTLVGLVTEAIAKYRPHGVFIDETGVGGGVVDRLAQMGHDVVGVNFGSGSDHHVTGTPVAANKRAEIWINLRNNLGRGLAIPDEDGLNFELLGPGYGYDGQNRMLLESKDSMAKRGIRSPDVADALALTYAYPVSTALSEMTAHVPDDIPANPHEASRAMAPRHQVDFTNDYDPYKGEW
jgi:hypothetical protein